METKKAVNKGTQMPAIALRGLVVFPSMLIHFDVERDKSIAALEKAMESNRRIFMVTQKDIEVEQPTKDDLYKIGVVAEIKQMLKISNDTIRVLVEGIYKAKIISLDDAIKSDDKLYLQAKVTRVNFRRPVISNAGEQAILRSLQQAFVTYCESVPKMPQEAVDAVVAARSPEEMFDAIVQSVVLHYYDRQELLELNDPAKRCERLINILLSEAEVMSLERDIMDKVKAQMDQNQQEYFLREQMKAIAEELGEGDNIQNDAASFEEKLESIKNMPDETREKLYKDCDRLYKTAASIQEAGVIRTYLETCLSLPWDEATKDVIDIEKAKKVLDKDHYGMEKIKNRILESLAVRKLNSELKGQIICFIGPPGVGKTSIAKAIAQAMGRSFQRISLGGVKDESDIRGHRKTYVGAMQGRVINAYIQAKSRNPLILFDEIDKMGNDFRGDPSAAMLEVLDSEQNSTFVDHYIEVPFDLSETLFVTTANSFEGIPEPLLDRMEIIELSSYTREEKYNIAKMHLIKKQRVKHGLKAKQAKISDSAIYDIIDHYTRESGVRKLEQNIAAVLRKCAKLIVEEGRKTVVVSADNIEKFLGKRKYLSEQILKNNEIGTVNGLAWTSVGGELLQIEAAVVEGTGKLEITGNLGDVMTESAKLAVTYVRSVADNYGISKDFYKTKDIHIHAPQGAVPKDGPSAGVTITTALVSALTGSPVKRDVAMTGEISLRGRVLPIGGLREKSMAAFRAGIKTVLIPRENIPDLDELDAAVKSALEFVPCDRLCEVLERALVKKPGKSNNIVIPPNNTNENVQPIRS